jgi:uncharacterized protein YjdB
MATMSAQRVCLLIRPTFAALIGLSCNGDGGGVTAPTSVATVEISPPEATIVPTGTMQLTATPKDAAGTTLTDRSVVWSSSDAAVATVSETGLVTGVAEGEAVITAVSDSKSGTAAITVRAPIGSIEMIPPSATILNGQNFQLTAEAKDAAGNQLNNRTVTWSSDATAVATVNSSGIVTGVGPGTATITASAEERSATAAITVTVLDVGGEWTFTETLSDPAIALTCANTATFALTQAGVTFSGTSDQTGECREQGEPIDNSGTFEITDGSVQSTTIRFTEPGDVTCVYEGSLVENPPTGASGTVTCTGLLGLFGPAINATGTWQMTRDGDAGDDGRGDWDY